MIGMAGRFPDAPDVDAFWHNIAHGVESLRRFSDEELIAAGVSPDVLGNPDFVPVRSLMQGAADFDADFFGFTPREAEITDPQQRVLLECAYEALEAAGYGDATTSRSVGVFVGVGENQYVLEHLLPRIDAFATFGVGMTHANSKDFAATRISYKLNLSGPSVSVNTACSTSLVALHQACASLALNECEMAMAGAASIAEFGPGGYVYQEGGIRSPDGRCRAFDHDAQGTRRGNGAGVVVLKRLDKALADGDTILAVIKGSAVNNDGSDKVGYTAPSVSGQARAIAQAYSNANISPSTIQYVEAHGTGTSLGDPIEMRALKQCFATATAKECAIGTVKPNIGHLDAAAGIAGLIKTVQALRHRQLPPNIGYERANAQIDFADGPFYVNTRLQYWNTSSGPRRAGVSSFGIGGTNAHVVLEEAPLQRTDPASRAIQLLVLSARTPAALRNLSVNLATYLAGDAAASLADVAYTLQVGRHAHPFRHAIACDDVASAIAALNATESGTELHVDREPSLVWMFPGQGTQYVNMTRSLYVSEPVFRAALDTCAEGLLGLLQIDLRDVLYPSPENHENAEAKLRQTWLAQPALFAVEYSMAVLLRSFGLQPSAMIGHSLGEYVAACLSGVFTLDDGLRLVATRGRLMQAMAKGRMVSVLENESRLRERLKDHGTLCIAAVNDIERCVVSGPLDAMAGLEAELSAEGIGHQALDTSHAFHSSMMDPMLAQWRDVLRSVPMQAPIIPYVSNLSGAFIETWEATSTEYWVRHLRETVRFGDGLDALMSGNAPLDRARILVEMGPGRVLGGLAKRRLKNSTATIISLLGHGVTRMDDARTLHEGMAQLWKHGVRIAWDDYHSNARRQRVPLPSYPFERRRYWVEAGPRTPHLATTQQARLPDHQDWFHVPLWRLRGVASRMSEHTVPGVRNWLLVADRHGLAERLAERLRQADHHVVLVRHGDRFERRSGDEFVVGSDAAHYEKVVDSILHENRRIDRVVHLGALDLAPAGDVADFDLFEASQRTGYYSLMFTVKALLKRQHEGDVTFDAVTHDAFRVDGRETPAPECAAIIGLCKVAPQEHSNLRFRHVDFSCSDVSGDGAAFLESESGRLFGEIMTDGTDKVVAFRAGRRWTQTFEAQRVPSDRVSTRIRRNGVYAITGGLGRVGLALAEHLAMAETRLVLIGRTALPERSSWDSWIETHDAEDATTRTLVRLLGLEARGARVWVCAADVSDESQMAHAFDKAETLFGPINGVIHAAGQVHDSIRPIVEGDLEHCREQFLPKVKGAMVLQRILAHRTVDFCVLMSSLSTVLGGLGFAAYAAANACLDTFAAVLHARGHETWLSIDWDGWHVSGTSETRNVYSVTGPEGARALDYALSWSDSPQLVHSTGHLKSRMDKWIDLSRTEPVGMRLYVRDSDENFVPPTDPVEQQLAEVWEQLLGIEGIGVEDDFFALGGDSLLATRLLSRVRELFPSVGNSYALREFFERPTISSGASRIRAALMKARLDEKRSEIEQGVQALNEGVF
ncbi:MAG: SDR family oxidoreductase [Luteibacter sp.]